MNNFVSIIVPVYNAEQYIEACIRSVLSQDYSLLELIIVDDGSNDRSAQICLDLAETEERIRFFSQPNSGVSAARNRGLLEARGEYITFVDADDTIEPSHISQLVQALLSADCAVCGYYLDYPDHSEKREFGDIPAMNSEQAMLNMLMPHLFQGFLCNKLFRAGVIAENGINLREDISFCEDLLFCAEYFSHCTKIVCTSGVTYHYLQRIGSAALSADSTCEQIRRHSSALRAFELSADYFAGNKQIRRLAQARVMTESALIFRRAQTGGAPASVLSPLKRKMRGDIISVIGSPLGIKEKIKYITTCICPVFASKFWVKRERKYFLTFGDKNE